MNKQPIIINIERMEKALATPSIKVPSGLTREETREFIIKHATLENKNDKEKI